MKKFFSKRSKEPVFHGEGGVGAAEGDPEQDLEEDFKVKIVEGQERAVDIEDTTDQSVEVGDVPPPPLADPDLPANAEEDEGVPGGTSRKKRMLIGAGSILLIAGLGLGLGLGLNNNGSEARPVNPVSEGEGSSAAADLIGADEMTGAATLPTEAFGDSVGEGTFATVVTTDAAVVVTEPQVIDEVVVAATPPAVTTPIPMIEEVVSTAIPPPVTDVVKDLVDTEDCLICASGLTVSDTVMINERATYIGLQGLENIDRTCAMLIQDAVGVDPESNRCRNMKQSEAVCCPAPASDPCPVCPSGLTVDGSVEVNAARTCDDLVTDARFVEATGEICTFMLNRMEVCCPANNPQSPQRLRRAAVV